MCGSIPLPPADPTATADIKRIQSDYAIYEVSDIFLLLHQLVEQGKKNPDYLFDIPYIKRGQVMLTEMGKSYVAQDNLNR